MSRDWKEESPRTYLTGTWPPLSIELCASVFSYGAELQPRPCLELDRSDVRC